MVAASAPFLPACAPAPRPLPGRFRFPQGLGSVDPTPDSVEVWSRVEAVDGAGDPVEVVVQVSPTDDFGRLVAERTLTAHAGDDHWVRVRVNGLQPDTVHHYRFLAGGDVTPQVGRTRTAPPAWEDRPIRFALVAGRDDATGSRGVWRTLMAEDEATSWDNRLDFVLYLGDAAPEMTAGATAGDVRHLSRTVLLDPELQAARARWPFMVVESSITPRSVPWGRHLELVLMGADAGAGEGVLEALVGSGATWRMLGSSGGGPEENRGLVEAMTGSVPGNVVWLSEGPDGHAVQLLGSPDAADGRPGRPSPGALVSVAPLSAASPGAGPIGMARLLCRRDRMEVEFLEMQPPRPDGASQGVGRRIHFTLPRWERDETPRLQGPRVEGE